MDYADSDKPLIIKEYEIKNRKPLVKESLSRKKQINLRKLENIFTSQELFLKKGLIIHDVAKKTEIPVHVLSELINSDLNLNFKNYVNIKRIEYFKRKINDPDWKDLTLEEMALKCGFSSRITCFRSFIKLTGKSPSQYFSMMGNKIDNIRVKK